MSARVHFSLTAMTEDARRYLAQVVAGVDGRLVGSSAWLPRSTRRVSKKLRVQHAQPGADADLRRGSRPGGECGRQSCAALRAVIYGVHARHVGEQDLRGADIGVGLFAPDVLLAGLQCHAQGLVAACVDRYADDTARQPRACTRRAWQRRPHAGHQSRSGRQNAATSQGQYRRPFRPAISDRTSAIRSAATATMPPRDLTAAIGPLRSLTSP
jgi:hypothetical protein